MTFSIITTTYAVLALAANAIVLVLLAGLILGRRGSEGGRRWSRLRYAIGPIATPFAWLVAVLATLGSLYLSIVVGLQPCTLCWYQRTAMYPLVLLLGIATLRTDLYTARVFCAPLAAAGALIAIYHYQLERFPTQASVTCSLDVPCSVPVLNVWGFVSVPYLAASAFLLIVAVLWVAREPASA